MFVNSCIVTIGTMIGDTHPARDFPLRRRARLSWLPVTEIPEHLLKRSQAAKSKAEGTPAPAESAPAASTPAVAAPSAPAAARAAVPAPAPEPVADIPVVVAYKQRKKIPSWAMLTLSILPVWAFMYLRAVTPAEVEAVGPLAAGAEVYNSCSSCHGGGGEGGVGYAFTNGEIMKTFPHIEDQLRFVYFGSQMYQDAGIEIYGNPEREGGPHVTKARGVMPAQMGALTDVDILNVVCHERYTLGGMEEGDEFATWCSEDSEIHAALESGSSTLANLHEAFPEIMPIGDAPLAGSPAS